MMRVALFSSKSYDQKYFRLAQGFEDHYFEFFESRLRKKTARLTEGFDAVCVFVNDELNRETLEIIAAKGVKLIVLRCAGFNNVDLPAAAELGISVRRVPAYSPHAVAEHALALILTLNRKTQKAYNRVREGNFSLERLEGFDLYGKTVAVIGTGKIGEVFARNMKGLGCNVVAFDMYPNQKLVDEGVLRYLSLDEIWPLADIISLHCPLTPETFHLINEITLAKMKPNTMLINTSRGKLVDTEATIESLKNSHLGYLGIDVYEQEENLFFKDLSEMIIRDDKMMRLMTFPNALVTGHQAYFTDNALNQIAETTLGNLVSFEKGEVNANVVGLELFK
jgi:D-lactate dehydrogenase